MQTIIFFENKSIFQIAFFNIQQTQNICIPFIQRRPNVVDVGPTLYKCYTNVLCLLGSNVSDFEFENVQVIESCRAYQYLDYRASWDQNQNSCRLEIKGWRNASTNTNPKLCFRWQSQNSPRKEFRSNRSDMCTRTRRPGRGSAPRSDRVS